MKNKNRQKTPSYNFSLLDAIRRNPMYKRNVPQRDKAARKFISESFDISSKKDILPGQLILFNYFEPKTRDQLEYYDASPCTIFFGLHTTDEGLRVIGFNLHYYPPRMRFLIMDRIFDIFKPLYLENWNDPLTGEISYFNYKMLMMQLRKAKLDFGVRQYIPSLMSKIVAVPPRGWDTAVFTEGKFRKETRTQILKYWRNKSVSDMSDITKRPLKNLA